MHKASGAFSFYSPLPLGTVNTRSGAAVNMAKLEFTLTKEKYDALSDELKAFYTTTKDGGYELEGVGSIQRALEAEKKGKAEAIDKALKEALGDLDPQAARDAVAKLSQLEQADLEAKGKYEEALAAREKAWQEKYERDLGKVTSEKETLVANLKRQTLANVLTEKGVLPDRVKYLANELDAQLELATDEAGFSLKKKGGIGDAAEFEAMIESVKQSSPFFFAANGASGSGASGSEHSGGMANGNLAELPPTERLAHLFKAGTTK